MADLQSQAVRRLPIKLLAPMNYNKLLMQRVIDSQVLVIKATQEDVKTLNDIIIDLEARIVVLEP